MSALGILCYTAIPNGLRCLLSGRSGVGVEITSSSNGWRLELFNEDSRAAHNVWEPLTEIDLVTTLEFLNLILVDSLAVTTTKQTDPGF